MTPDLIERESLWLAGVTQTGKSVADVDIHGLWGVYQELEAAIPGRIEGAWYELHVGAEAGIGIYAVMAGAEIGQVGDLPVEISVRRVPGGPYAHFRHPMKEGDYGEAFARVDAWTRETGTGVRNFGLQLYDRDFDPHDPENSILHIFIPLQE